MPKKGGVLKDLFEELLLGLSVLRLRKAAYSKIFRGVVVRPIRPTPKKGGVQKILLGIVVRPIRPMPKKGGVLEDLSRTCC